MAPGVAWGFFVSLKKHDQPMSDTNNSVQSESTTQAPRPLLGVVGKLSATVFAALALLAIPGAYIAYEKWVAGSDPFAKSTVVTFDTVRYLNSRRAAALDLMGGDLSKAEESISTLAQVDRGVVPAIEKAAQGRLVIVKQALVVEGSAPDITDDVLVALGLPTDAPTIRSNATKDPVTEFSQSPLYKFAEEFVREENELARKKLQEESRGRHNEWLP